MLVLSRRVGEEIVIAGDIRLTILAIKGNQICLGFTAPSSVRVDRQEVHAQRAKCAAEFNRAKDA
jgi:carbon storage regulator